MIVTLLTDFGTADYFVGAMKGAVLAVNPRAQVVDLTHEIPAHDIEAGAFTLLAACETFPPGTVHVGVVDPGVGSSRRPVVVDAGGRFYVGPDNGLFGHVYEREPAARVFHVTNRDLFRPSVSTTFHGRDVFAPVAGALSKGVVPDELGAQITDFVRLARPAPRRDADGTLRATVIHVDRFGNCVTDITPAHLAPETIARGARLRAGRHHVDTFRTFYAEAQDAPGGREPFAIWGSAGFLEISVFQDSAARLLGLGRGDSVEVLSAES